MIAGSLRPFTTRRQATPRGCLTWPGEGAWRDRGSNGHYQATTGHDPLMRYVELRRHTDNEGDLLTPQGAADAEMIGRDGLHPPYAAFVSTGAARATQMLEILRHAAGQDDTPITAAAGLRSSVEDRWRDAAKAAGKQADLNDIRAIDPDLVERESWLLGSVLRQVVAELPEGGRALVVGHSPTTEAAVLGLAGQVVPPLGKGKGVLLVEDGGDYQVEPLD
jgi:phosphohistidine phosphatase SixA